MPTIEIRQGDSFDVLKAIPDGTLEAVVTDPPYGLSFMSREWDDPTKLWKTGAGMSKPGIGDRSTEWVSHGASNPFGGANPTCQECGGRLWGKNQCECEDPVWIVDGEREPGKKHIEQMCRMQKWHEGWLREVFRVLKPGGVAKVFAAPRTMHRLATAMESVGFVLNPGHSCEAWTYGSGFPKSLNVSRTLDRQLGVLADREVIGYKQGVGGENLNDIVNERGSIRSTEDPGGKGVGAYGTGAKQVAITIPVTAPASPEAKKWDGYGTALKPAWEPFIVGRKPG